MAGGRDVSFQIQGNATFTATIEAIGVPCIVTGIDLFFWCSVNPCPVAQQGTLSIQDGAGNILYQTLLYVVSNDIQSTRLTGLRLVGPSAGLKAVFTSIAGANNLISFSVFYQRATA